MNTIALQLLTHNTKKFCAIIFGVAFGTLLMADQMSVFCGVMRRTTSQITDVHADGIWVLHPHVKYIDELTPLSANDLQRVRGVPGVAWATPLYKGTLRAKTDNGSYRQAIVLGLDDASLVGAPQKIIYGDLADLRMPDAAIVDKAGFSYLWPDEPISLGRVFHINDHRAVLVGVCDAAPPFQTLPIIYTKFSDAKRFASHERKHLACVLVHVDPGELSDDVCNRITAQTGLQALTGDDFFWKTIAYYFRFTGIPLNFFVTVGLGFVVGLAITGQTFYMFTVDNLKHFAVLKALGVDNLRLTGMILLQGVSVGLLGYLIGLGLTCVVIEVTTTNIQHLAGFYLPWQVAVGTGTAISQIMVMSSIVSIRQVIKLEPAVVFRG